ncbi:hypothetical protein MFIFM68171_03846 [Madurella fahalii]|uniref:Uncharacterized protein n=1 Tax=Madurella fahalii TaxID=1157608 RepID=A0ABQ0G7C4_9PEZI
MWALAPKTLDISLSLPDGNANAILLAASFDLGVIHGTMRLSLSEHAIREFIKAQDPPEQQPGGVQVGVHRQATTAAAAAANADGDGTHAEHGAGWDGDTGIETRKRKATPHPAESAVEPSGAAHRVYFAFRCRNSLSGAVYPETRAGYADFAADGWSGVTSFRGVASFPVLGDEVDFVGHRVGVSGGLAPRWEDYSFRVCLDT